MAYRFKTRSTTPTEIRLTAGACAHLFAEQQAKNSDPGVEHVESGVSYKIQNIDKVGEYVIPPETPHFIFNETTVLSRGS